MENSHKTHRSDLDMRENLPKVCKSEVIQLNPEQAKFNQGEFPLEPCNHGRNFLIDFPTPKFSDIFLVSVCVCEKIEENPTQNLKTKWPHSLAGNFFGWDP